MTYDRTCAGCSERFTAKSPRAKWCGSTCRSRGHRAGQVAEPTAPDPAPDVESHGLVETTRRELEQAGVLESFHAQLALQLARRLAQPDESAPSSLSRELDRVMTAALEGAPAPAAAASEPEEDDEVTKARKARERKASNAARRA